MPSGIRMQVQRCDRPEDDMIWWEVIDRWLPAGNRIAAIVVVEDGDIDGAEREARTLAETRAAKPPLPIQSLPAPAYRKDSVPDKREKAREAKRRKR
tara:strand:- start:175 stop:465 length:291 start_codon:yes stop_codon:yes gene_type:complete